MPVATTCPEAAYLTKPNIVMPTTVTVVVTAAEVRARSEIAAAYNGVSVTGGAIKKLP